MLTYIISCFREGSINIIFCFPHSGNTMFVVSETLLEMTTQFRKNGRISCLLVNLRSENDPGPFAKGGYRFRILVVCAVECWT
jgi:hypothetical protein